MSRFTAGERRGLIVLILLLLIMTAWISLRECARDDADASLRESAVRFDSINSDADTSSLKIPVRWGEKRKKTAKDPKVSKPVKPRSPLDEEVN